MSNRARKFLWHKNDLIGIFFQRERGQIAAESASNGSLIKYAYDVTWLTHRSRGNFSSHKRLQWRSTEERHMRAVPGKNTP